MHITLPKKIEEKLRFWRRRLLPRTLFFRTMLLIFIPLIVVQVVSVVVFFDGSWSRMGRRLSESLVDDIKIIIDLKHQQLPINTVKQLALKNMQISFSYYDYTKTDNIEHKFTKNSIIAAYLKEAMEKNFPSQNWSIFIDKNSRENNDLIITIEETDGIYQFSCAKKKIFSSSIFMFVVWMIATSILLFLVSVMFLRIQVRAIADMAQTAENFGKGIDDDSFKPYGSSEVRKAGHAFLRMKERIVRQIMERTQMLAGISHDLRTPLTRMKLLVTMMPSSQDRSDCLADIEEMQKMLNGYLSFVRGEGDEIPVSIEVNQLLENIVARFIAQKSHIKYYPAPQPIVITAKEQALRRAITNIFTNANRYGKKIEAHIETIASKIHIIIEDNGPGIPQDKREAVFRAFYRLDNSRNKETGGIGLGLAITKDIITAHGGTITLADSVLGGLKVIIELPL